jgi:hypothetical protein
MALTVQSELTRRLVDSGAGIEFWSLVAGPTGTDDP